MLHFFSLLAVDDAGAEKPMNAKSGGGDESLLLYLRCAATLSATLRAHSGAGLTILTNDRARLERASSVASIRGLEFLEIACSHDGPAGSAFRLAIHKLDALAYLAGLADECEVVLLDSDMFATADLRPWFEGVFQRAELGLYEITAHEVPEYGAAVVAADLATVAGRVVPIRWFGGEVLAARPPTLRRLLPHIEECYERYLQGWPTLNHNGDEVIVSAAIHLLAMDGVATEDLGTTGVVRRFWSVLPRREGTWVHHPFAHPLLHLPADKEFLASLTVPEDPVAVGRRYRLHRRLAPAQVLRRAARTPLVKRLRLRISRG